MSRTDVILPRADASCGKVFFDNRRTADCHRIGLEVWNRATGRSRPGFHLAVFRCRRCGGFHIGHRADEVAPKRTPIPASEGRPTDQLLAIDNRHPTVRFLPSRNGDLALLQW